MLFAVVVLTDGGSDYPPATAIQADLINRAGDVTMLAVGISEGPVASELQRIASQPSK